MRAKMQQQSAVTENPFLSTLSLDKRRKVHRHKIVIETKRSINPTYLLYSP